MPYDELEFEARISELEGYKNSEIIVYCKAGGRSQLASELLVEYGFTKVYNMLGGILAWIDADYPIWTTQHYVTVDGKAKPKIHIEPLLLYQTGCSSCTDNQECPDNSEAITITSTVLEQDDNHIIILLTYEFDGITYEFTIINTLLWSYNEITNEINRTASFILTEITTDDTYMQFYQLNYLAQHDEYNFTLLTILNPLNSEFYNKSSTLMILTPTEKKINTFERIEFNSIFKLSEMYNILGKVARKIGKIYDKSYKISEDKSIAQLAQNYFIIEDEVRSLSKLVKRQLSEYNLQILESSALLLDFGQIDCVATCFWIQVFGCGLIAGFFCAAVALILGLTGWGAFFWAIGCEFVYVVICGGGLGAMTFEECIDWCLEMY